MRVGRCHCWPAGAVDVNRRFVSLWGMGRWGQMVASSASRNRELVGCHKSVTWFYLDIHARR